jgi:hypothetical protein
VHVKLSPKRTVAVAAAGASLLVGSGAALAHGGPGMFGFGPGHGSQTTLLNDLATRLGVSNDKLRSSVKAALKAQVDQQVKDGQLTAAQATDAKARIDSGTVRIGVGPPEADLGVLDAAAGYLGITVTAIRDALGKGTTLADLAKTAGKTSDGLQAAIVAKATANLAAAVTAGDLTDAQRDTILTRLKTNVGDLVAQARGAGGHGRLGDGPGFRGIGPAFRKR